MKRILAFLLLTLAHSGFAQYPKIGKIYRLDPELDEILDTSTPIELIATGFQWSEGPVWVKNGNFLLFTDVPNNIIHKWSEAKGLELFMNKAGYDKGHSYSQEPGANGLIINHKGNLVACQHGNRQLAEISLKDRKVIKSLAHLFEGKQLNSPNDLVQSKSGDYYFTDPPFGLPGRGIEEPAKELAFQGVYRIDRKGKLSVQEKTIERPNGLAFNPDQRILYVASSGENQPYIYAYKMKPNGDLGEKSVFYDKGGSDGMKVNSSGYVFATGRFTKEANSGDVLIINQAGKLIGRLDTGNKCSNVAFGENEKVIYITSSGNLLRLKLK